MAYSEIWLNRVIFHWLFLFNNLILYWTWIWTSLRVFLNDLDCEFHLPTLVTLMVMQAYCIIFLKLKLQKRFKNLAERLKLQLFAKIFNSFKDTRIAILDVCRILNTSLDCSLNFHSNCYITYFQTTITETLNLIYH